jgi:hypothetical protein
MISVQRLTSADQGLKAKILVLEVNFLAELGIEEHDPLIVLELKRLKGVE